MPKTRKPYPPEFREQLVALVRAGRTPEDLAREFEPTGQSISNWVAQSDREAGQRTDGLTTAERTELTQLRRKNRRLKLERDILSKAAAWFAQETAPNATHWSVRTMAKAQDLSPTMTHRIWQAHGLQPHRVETFKLSRDPEFVKKLRDVVGVYLHRCFRHQLLLPRPYLVLTKPLRLDIQCQRGASVKIGWKYLDD